MAIDFPGVSGSGINVGNPASLDLTGSCTIMCWINLNADIQNIDIISKYKSSPRGFTLQTDDSPPDDTFGIFIIAKTSSTLQGSGWTANPLVTGTWYHLAGQFVPNTAVQVWLDGILSSEKTGSIPATMYNPVNDLHFASRPEGGQNLNGILDDIRIYNRNLSAAEMITIHTARGRDNIIEGLVSRWSVNEGASGVTLSGSNSIKDLGANGNHGTPEGSPVYGESIL